MSRRLAVMGEPSAPCEHETALRDAARRYGAIGGEIACHGCIDAPDHIPSGGLQAEWWDWSTWNGPEHGTLSINTVPRGAGGEAA